MKDVAFSCDDNGAKFLCVTVWSLLSHYQGKEPIRINVFEGFGGHSEESKRQLREIVSRFPLASVRYIDVERAVAPYRDILVDRANSRWNIFTWTPIFTPLLLEDAEGNVAHLDIDMLFNDDVSKLLDLDLGDNLIAAVSEYGRGDPIITEAVWGKGILPETVDRYFNTGTLVFNTEKCREERTWEKLIAWYREHYEIADRIEQDAWNALYWNRTQLLPLRWNFHDRLMKHYAKWSPREKYWQGNPPSECLEAALNPGILHFWGPKKPWKPSHRPYRKLYHEAMKAVGLTPPREEVFGWWHDLQAERIRSRLQEKMRNLVHPGLRKWRRRQMRRRIWQVLLWPFEWLGIALGLLTLCPLPHRVLLGCCDFLSAIMYCFDRRGKRLALENLRIVLGRRGETGRKFDPDRAAYDPSPRERLVIRRSYRNMARTVGHIFWTMFAARRRVARVGEVSDASRSFLQANRPAVTVSGHIGCWEILSQLALLEGHTMMSVAKHIGTSGITELLLKARKSIGQEIVPAEGAMKFLLQGARAGKSLGLLVDQRVSPRRGGLWVRFMGRPLPVSAAPAFFAAKTKMPIIVAWSRPLRDGRYRAELVETIPVEESRDIWKTTQRCMAALESVIRRHPSCWVMNYNEFRDVPTEQERAQLERRERGLRDE